MQEEHQSELALSGWYLTGAEGVLQPSDTEAYLWARKAAQAGLAKAEYAMGYFTEVGIVGPASIEEAKRWYWRSACKLYIYTAYPLLLCPFLLSPPFSIFIFGLAHRSTNAGGGTPNSTKFPQGPRTSGGAAQRRAQDAENASISIGHSKIDRGRVYCHVKKKNTPLSKIFLLFFSSPPLHKLYGACGPLVFFFHIKVLTLLLARLGGGGRGGGVGL